MNLSKITKLTLIALCLALLFLYFFKINNIPFIRLDDGELLQLSANFATHGYLGSEMMNTEHNENLYYHVHPPFYYLVNGLVFKLIGVGVLQSRLVSLLSALVVIMLTFLLSTKMVKLKLALNNLLVLSVLFLSTPIFFVLARSNRPEMLAAALILTAMLFYEYYQERRKVFPLMISGLGCGLAFTTQFYALFISVLIFIRLLLNQQKNWRHFTIWLAAALLPIIGYVTWISRDIQAFIYQIFTARHAAENLSIIKIIIRYKHFFLSFETIATTFFFVLILCVILWRKIKDKGPLSAPALPIIATLSFLAIFIFIPVLNKYYYVIILPFIYLFYISILRQNQNRLFAGIIILYILINLCGLGIYWNKYRDFDYTSYGQRILAQLPPPGNFSLLASPSLYPALHSYQFYAFNNGSIIKPGQTYEGLKTRLKQLGVTHIIYQEYNEKLYAELNYVNQFFRQDCRLIATIQEPHYGSEGQKKNNYIKIFAVINR